MTLLTKKFYYTQTLLQELKKAGLPCSRPAFYRFLEKGVIEEPERKVHLEQSNQLGQTNRIWSREEIRQAVKNVSKYQNSK